MPHLPPRFGRCSSATLALVVRRGERVPRRSLTPGRRDGPVPAAHDPRVVPALPEAAVEIRRDAEDDAWVVFSYKVEYGFPPYPVLHVRRDWLSVLARPGHVVLDGYPVLDIVERDPVGRPVAVRVAVVGGFFDSTMHGWRAHADTHHAVVSWDRGTPTVTVGGWADGR
jgi:hypothetical protein